MKAKRVAPTALAVLVVLAAGVQLLAAPTGALDLREGVLGSPPPPHRDIQETVWFQGYLTDDATGDPIEATYTVEARIYDAEVGGASVWGPEAHVGTAVSGGWFSIELGSVVAPLPAFDDPPYYLQIWIDGEMLDPRLKLASVPSAFQSLDADNDGLTLPYSAMYSDPGTAFAITYQGPNICGLFYTDNPASSAAALYGKHNGSGAATLGWAEGDGPGVKGVSDGAGSAVLGVSNAGGHAGEFDGTVRITDTLRVEGPIYGADAVVEHSVIVGDTLLTAGFMMPTGAAEGYVLTCDDSWGSASWQPVGFSLPYSGSVSSADPTAAVAVTQTGTGPAYYGMGSGDYTAHFESDQGSPWTDVVRAEYVGLLSYSDVVAVRGKSVPTEGYGYGGMFDGGFRGVLGYVEPDGGSTYAGVEGMATGGLGTNMGVMGSAAQSTGTNYSVYGGVAYGGAINRAGFFNGDTEVTGFLYKTGGGFKIDHPLDPENSYLYHSFVESPDMMNIYNGNVTLDGSGQATVELPDWFEAVNGDFRYQLTAVGAPGPNLHIAERISGGRFRIAGGEPGMDVSWQVTGIRHDPAAELKRIPVVEEKPEQERGKYRVPEAYGKPREMGVGYIDEERERRSGS
jgi:hypothetical protein